jgi:ribose-phosphate pyrophosphokinase
VARIKASKLKSLVVTDSIAATEDVAKCPNIRRISIAALLGDAIDRIANEKSVSSLFD